MQHRDLTIESLGVFAGSNYFLWLSPSLPRVIEDEDLVDCRTRGMPLHVTLGFAPKQCDLVQLAQQAVNKFMVIIEKTMQNDIETGAE